MREQFAEILKQTQNNQIAQMDLVIDNERYTRMFRPKERLILLGAGHIAQPLCEIAAMLGFSVTVVDDRPSFANHPRFPQAEHIVCDAFPHAIEHLHIHTGDYVAVITRGHRYDADCLRSLLAGTMPLYLGMLGSKRRTIALLHMLAQEGFAQDKLDSIYTPIGLDIGALSVQEIAVSIAAQLVQTRRRGLNRRSKSHILTEETFRADVVEDIVSNPLKKALLLVYETSGSTPVKSGSFMTVNEMFQAKGTIGGGCSESAVLRDAFHLIGTGESKCVTVDMNNDVAAEQGMVCGGQMKIFLTDLNEV
ncbi:XdhC family protein [Butyricicoccus intestinisimiae]|uniref:XdhC family protein n=1 Tax=Butyricicoccus intestinisimiae TaxID=2841509 RepID=A0ABS6ES17_9FIRM|nr:XdhC/CoxI family protein [Butyricicoccus intestinisimiae]MBU5490303.1 XdhC family protein [Butyricicoccus intestinisimiae]